MKIVLITPYYHPPVRGNAVTVGRIARNLSALGCEVVVLSLDLLTEGEIHREVARLNPDLIHAFHGYLGGRVARHLWAENDLPFVVTLTGSDVYEALSDSRRGETLEVLRDAAAIVAFDRSVGDRIPLHHPDLSEKIRVIPQGVELPGDNYPWGDERFDGGEFIFFLPAGLRPVKNVGFPIPPLAELHREDSRVRLLLAGPILDEEYGAGVLADLDKYNFVRYLGVVGRDSIGALYRRADVVLNTSLFEGGMANSLLEAMAFGKPVLVSDIEGNRSLIEDGKTGLIFRSEEEFSRKARMLLLDGELRRRLGEAGCRLAMERFSPTGEALAYLELYGKVTGRKI